MKPVQAERAKEIFLGAVEIDRPEPRDAFLDAACGADPALRRRVEALLDAHRRTDGLLDRAAVDATEFAALDSAPPCPLAEPAGTVIGPYTVVEMIGEGGMGIVYLAEQTRPVRRKVALKIIKPGMDTRQVVARFEAERQALALMDHPNIARVFDAGATEAGRPYFVMELVRGIAITGYCDVERLDIPDRLRLFVAVCLAVEHAHQKGVIHRDLKPSNILITVIDGQAIPKIIDFGVAKAMTGRLTEMTLHTGFHQFVGTPLYMSPEQAALSGVDADTRSDIYSLGVLLYELVTGTTPIERDAAQRSSHEEVRRMVREVEPPRPSTRLGGSGARLAGISADRQSCPRRLRKSVRGELDWIAMKALEKDRGRRYQSAGDLAADVVRYLEGRPLEAVPPSASYRFKKYARRNKTLLTTAALVALALVAGTAASLWQAVRATRAERRIAAALEESDRHRLLAERHLYATRLRFANQALDSDQFERAREILLALEAEPRGYSSGEFAWGYVRMRARETLRPVGRVGEAGRFAVPSPDGRTLASFDPDGPIHLIDRGTLRHLAALPSPGPLHPSETRFSPDGNRLMAIESDRVPGSDRRAWIWDVPSRRLLREFHPPEGRRTEWMTLCPAGRFITETVSLAGDHRLRADLWDLPEDGPGPRWLATLAEGYSWGESSADGRLFATAESDRIAVHGTLAGAARLSLGEGTRDGLEWRLGFSADGRTLVARSARRVEFWDLARGELASSRGLDASANLDCVWASPDGQTLCIFDVGGAITLWDRRTGRSRAIRPDRLAGEHEFQGKFSSDGSRLMVISRLRNESWGPLKIYDAATGSLLATCPLNSKPESFHDVRTADGSDILLDRSPVAQIWWPGSTATPALAGHAGEAWALAFSPDGTTLASGSDNTKPGDTLKLWDVATGKPLRGWRIPAGGVSALAFSPDGKTLASATLAPSDNLWLWDVATGRPLARLEGHTDRVRSVAFSPDGSIVASAGSDPTIRLWNGRNGRPLGELAGHSDTVRKVAFSPDGKTLASASNDRTIRLWDVSSAEAKRTIPGLRKNVAVAFSPDGSSLAAADEGGGITLWDPATGGRMLAIHGHDDELLTMAFSPDGGTLATAGLGRSIWLWDPLTGQELIELKGGHQAQVNGLAFSPDGKTLASCSHDGAVRLWRSDATHSAP